MSSVFFFIKRVLHLSQWSIVEYDILEKMQSFFFLIHLRVIWYIKKMNNAVKGCAFFSRGLWWSGFKKNWIEMIKYQLSDVYFHF